MVICKYFLRGTCRFGENCKNEHSYNDNSGSVLRKKQDIDPNVIIKSVSNDMDKAENGNQWPFSCYGPFQGKPCFPGFEDKCFEEIRLGLYEAERNGTAEQYKQQLTQLINETRMKMRSLQNPTPEATNVLKELFNSSENQNSNSVFGNNPTTQPTIFGNTHAGSQNVFPDQPVASNTGNNFSFTLPENKSIFGSAANNQVSSGSIFNQNNQSAFSTSNNIFGGGPTKSSIFANAQHFAPNTNVFQTNNTPPNTNVFQTNNTSPNTNLFQTNNTPSNTNVFQTNTTSNPNTGSIFGNQQNNQLYAQQPTTGASIFAHNSPFTQNNTTPNQANPFTQNTADLFRSQQNTFQQQSTVDAYQPPVGHQSPFSTSSSFGQNSVLHSQNPATKNNLEEHAKSIFGSMQSQVGFPAPVESRRHEDATIYSKLEDLSDKDIKCYEAASFEFGKIPENPPTLQMC